MNKKQELKKVNRFYTDFTYRKKLNRFNFSIRNRLLKQGLKDDYEDVSYLLKSMKGNNNRYDDKFDWLDVENMSRQVS